MFCPSCHLVLTTTDVKSNRPDTERLFCPGQVACTCTAASHIVVSTKDESCLEYNFFFDIEDERYYLYGYDYLNETSLSNRYAKMIAVDFIPITIDDYTHEEVRKLFYRLKDLIVFS